jgi:hypothetical protein
MLARDREEWRRLTELLDAHPDTIIHDPESPAWTARDVYSHFTRWLNHSTDDLEANLAGRTLPRPEGTDDEINARWQAEDAVLSLAEARRRAQAAFDRRINVIEAVPDDSWNPAVHAIANADGYEHIEAHRSYVEAALGRVAD